METSVIRLENIGKMFHIGAQQAANRTFREAVTDTILAPWRRAAAVLRGHAAERAEEDLWALRGVSFEVRQGETLGVIGRNGAGKSTLLKILARITEPTEGTIGIKGRVGSLLEVGTGFHPELTGRENTFLNGAILGMKREAIRRKFDEIVAFAQIERFVDTPVKHYSSGMYMRLAFSVAAHLEPDILLVDEVLAVGDAQFQKKCIGKMGEVARQGRTVVFVSHNLSAIRSLCSRCLLLSGGQAVASGDPETIIGRYVAEAAVASAAYQQPEDHTKPINLRQVRITDARGKLQTEVPHADGFNVEIRYEVHQEVTNTLVWAAIYSAEQVLVFAWGDCDYDPAPLGGRPPGFYVANTSVPGHFLNVGSYTLVVGITGYSPLKSYDRVEAAQFSVYDHETYPLQEMGSRGGILKPRLAWSSARLEKEEIVVSAGAPEGVGVP